MPFWIAAAWAAAAAVWAVTKLPGPLSPGARSNLVLGLGLTVLSVWWLLALLARREGRLRVAMGVCLAGAVAGAIPALALAFARFPWVPDAWAFRALVLFALELPLWALALLLWPPPEEARFGSGSALRLGIAAAGGALAVWLLVVRPWGGFSMAVLRNTALWSWAFVLGCLAVSVARGTRRDLRAPFGLLLAGLGVVTVGNLVLTLTSLPRQTVFVSGMIALLLRLGAAEILRSRPRPAPEPGADQPHSGRVAPS